MLFDPWIRRGGQGKSKKKSVLFLSQRLERATILPLGPIHLEDEMSFRDELFRPGGQNLAWKFVLRKEAEKFVLFWGLIFWGQNCAWGRNLNQDEINVLMTWLSNNSRRDTNRTHFALGFFAFSNWSCKTTSSVKKALQKGQCKGQLLGYRIVEIFSFEGRRGDFT